MNLRIHASSMSFVARMLSAGSPWPRRLITLVLIFTAVLIAWRLLMPFVGPSHPLSQALHAPTQPMRDSMQLVVEIEGAHIFGTAKADGVPNETAGPADNIAVEGIIYSDVEEQSIASLRVDGTAVVAQVGTHLPDGETVAHILADRVELDGPGGAREALLDIKQASPDQRLASLSLDGTEQDDDDATPVAQPFQAPAFIPARAPVQRVPTHFRSLAELRGRKATPRFDAVKPP